MCTIASVAPDAPVAPVFSSGNVVMNDCLLMMTTDRTEMFSYGNAWVCWMNTLLQMLVKLAKRMHTHQRDQFTRTWTFDGQTRIWKMRPYVESRMKNKPNRYVWVEYITTWVLTFCSWKRIIYGGLESVQRAPNIEHRVEKWKCTIATYVRRSRSCGSWTQKTISHSRSFCMDLQCKAISFAQLHPPA